MRETKPLECYALLIAKVTSLSSTYGNYNQSKVDEAFENWNCSRATTNLSCMNDVQCPHGPGGGGGGCPPEPEGHERTFVTMLQFHFPNASSTLL